MITKEKKGTVEREKVKRVMLKWRGGKIERKENRGEEKLETYLKGVQRETRDRDKGLRKL